VRAITKANPWHALNTLVGGTDEKIDIQFGHIQRDAAEAAHGIDDIGFSVLARQYAHFGNRVQDPGGRFAMHHRNMADGGILFQDRFQGLYLRAGDFTAVVYAVGDTHQIRHFRHSRTVCTVADDQHFIVCTDGAAEHGFNRVAAAAL
jgi:hypothetical protein